MEIEKYITDRVDGQIKWFSTNSNNNKRYYITTKVVLTIIAAIIPALTAYIDNNIYIKILIGVLSVIMAILANITTLFGFKDNWTKYRNICEMLKSEKNIFLAGAGKYKTIADKDTLFVETIESYLQSENQQWLAALSQAKEQNA